MDGEVPHQLEIFVPEKNVPLSIWLDRSVLGEYPVFVAPEPLLARLGRDDYGVVGLVVMLCHMSIRRIVTAERDAAGLADPEVDPFIPRFYTFFTDQFFGLL